MINFVSHLPRELRSGGFSAINVAALTTLEKIEAVRYVGPLRLRSDLDQKVLSKALRTVGLPGAFVQYSQRRLKAIARDVESRSAAEARLDFFHGFTPWVLTKPRRPYIAWSDCTFRDYIDLYHQRGEFRAQDLHRIEQAEAAWLKGARRVAFTSAWAADRAIEAYGLSRQQIDVVGIFGETEMPDRDVYAGAKQFAFVATNFEAKGGAVVLAAFQQVRESHPDATLVIVGDQPRDMKCGPGVIMTGFLRKEDHEQHRRYRQILAQSRAIVHPTKSDVAPLLVVEAGYFGSPVISSRRFAIPELVDDEHTGVLLDNPADASAVAAAMIAMLNLETRYRAMRQAAWAKARDHHSRVGFERRFLAFLSAAEEGP